MARNPRDRPATSLDENALNLRELAVFVEEDHGFQLGLATYDVPQTRDESIHRLEDALADRPVHLTRLDLTNSPREEFLLLQLQDHLRSHAAPEGKRPAVMVIGMEAAINFRRGPDGLSRGGPLLQNANLQRDSFPALCSVPVVFWLSPFATTAFAQSAPDLWHWRSATFTFAGTPEARSRIEHDLIATPLLAMGKLAPEEKRGRIGMLRDLLSELELAEDRETLGNQARRAEILHEIGVTCHQLCEWMTALEHFDESLRLFRAIGDRRGEGFALGNMGSAYADLGQPERAIGLYEQALEIVRDIGDRRSEGNTLGSMGIALKNLGQPERAIGLYEQALEIARDIGDRRGEGSTLGNMGIALKNLGQSERAIGLYEQALEIARDIGDRRAEGNALGNMGSAYDVLGQPERAIGLYEQQLEIARDIGDRRGEGIALGNMGRAYDVLGQPERAIGLYEQALEIARDIGDRRGEGIALGNMGRAYAGHGQPERAIGLYERALEIARDIGDRRSEGFTLANLGNAYADLGQTERAVSLLKQSMEIGESIQDPRLVRFATSQLK